MAKPKAKHGKKSHRFKFRNDMRPARAASSRAAPTEKKADNKKELTTGQATIYSASGAAAAALTCALVARYNVMPAVFATAVVGAIGGTTAVVSHHPALQAAGQGALAAAGAQFGLVLLDNHYKENAAREALAESKPSTKKPANAESLPPGALEAAYERARRRLAMAEAASQMAA